MGSVLAQNLILLASVVVGMITLVYLIKYVKATKGIEKAANEQSEGLSKPVIAVESFPAVDDYAIINGYFAQIGQTGVQLVNVGTGPAIRLKWSATGQNHSDPSHESKVSGFVPSLKPNEVAPIGCSRSYVSGLDYLTVECSYSSVSGASYVSYVTIGDQDSTAQSERFKIVNFEVKRTTAAGGA